jgi:hypothetical protein
MRSGYVVDSSPDLVKDVMKADLCSGEMRLSMLSLSTCFWAQTRSTILPTSATITSHSSNALGTHQEDSFWMSRRWGITPSHRPSLKGP